VVFQRGDHGRWLPTYARSVQQPAVDGVRSVLAFVLLLAAAAISFICISVAGLGWMMLHGYGSCGPVTPDECNDSIVGPLLVIVAFGFVALWAPIRWALWWRRTQRPAAAGHGPGAGGGRSRWGRREG
jgi:hypothetical protein